MCMFGESLKKLSRIWHSLKRWKLMDLSIIWPVERVESWWKVLEEWLAAWQNLVEWWAIHLFWIFLEFWQWKAQKVKSPPHNIYIYIYIYICWETYPEKLIHDFISKINKYMKSWHFTSFLWKEKFFTSKASNNSYIGMFTKLHKLHKLQKSHQNRSQNGITAPHRK